MLNYGWTQAMTQLVGTYADMWERSYGSQDRQSPPAFPHLFTRLIKNPEVSLLRLFFISTRFISFIYKIGTLASRECAVGSLLQGANDVWKRYTSMKACQNGANGEDCSFKKNSISRRCLSCVKELEWHRSYHTDSITRSPPQYQHATSTCHSASLCLLMWALARTVQSQLLVINCGLTSSENNYSCSFTSGAQARHESSGKRGFLSYPAQSFPF